MVMKVKAKVLAKAAGAAANEIAKASKAREKFFIFESS
jgi:hypothetical protein